MMPFSVMRLRQSGGGAPAATTWNPSDKAANITLSVGNLRADNAAVSSFNAVRANVSKSAGKWYWETVATLVSASNFDLHGIMDASALLASGFPGFDTHGWGYYEETGAKYFNNTPTAYGAAYAQGDVIGHALDLDTGTYTCYKNGVSQGTLATGLTGTWFPAIGLYTSGNAITGRFKASAFTQTVPSGFTAIGV